MQAEYAKQAARSVQDSFAEFLFDPFDKGLKGMADNFAKTMAKIASQIAA